MFRVFSLGNKVATFFISFVAAFLPLSLLANPMQSPESTDTILTNVNYLSDTNNPNITVSNQPHDHHDHSNMDMWMFSLMPMYMNMNGYKSGDHSVSAPQNDMMVPKNMDMYMLMMMAMYSRDEWSAMVMSSYNIYKMDMDMNMMGMTETSTMRSSGFGDTQLLAGYKFLHDARNTLEMKFGVSVPTGRINYRGSMAMMGDTLYGYNMQLGSGTFDPIIAAAYSYEYSDTMIFNGEVSTLQRLYENYRGYRLGSQYIADASVEYTVSPWFMFKPEVEVKWIDKVRGVANGTNADWGISYNPDDTGGTIMNLFLTGQFNGTGAWRHSNIALQFGVPIYQYLNGTQLKQSWQASANVTMMLMD